MLKSTRSIFRLPSFSTKLFLVFYLPLYLPFLSYSATYLVTNGSDAGPGSLRQAVADANANPGADIIDVQPSVFVITLSTTDAIAFENNLPSLSDVTINGNNAVILSTVNSRFANLGDDVVLNNLRFTGFTYGCLHVNPSNAVSVSINNCDFSNCMSNGTFPFAGAIWHIDGQLNLSSCAFTNCSGNASGSIFCSFSSDKLTMNSCSFLGNTSTNNGGNANGIYLEGPLNVELQGAMTFGSSPTQDIYPSAADAPFTGSVILLPSAEISIGNVLDVFN